MSDLRGEISGGGTDISSAQSSDRLRLQKCPILRFRLLMLVDIFEKSHLCQNYSTPSPIVTYVCLTKPLLSSGDIRLPILFLQGHRMFFTSVVIPLAFIGISACVTCGVIAVMLPQTFGKLAAFLGTWIETRPVFKAFDSRLDVDHYFLRYTRAFGAIVLLASAFWASLLAEAIGR